MKTGSKISLIYSGITIGLVVITALLFLFVASDYTNDIYYHYLEEKAHALAEEKFSEDELDPVIGQLSRYLDEEEIKRLLRDETIDFENGEEVGTAFVYYDNTGTFAVVVVSRNPFIGDINRVLLWGLLLLVLLSAGVLYLISRIYANRMLDRIDKDYQTEKMFVNNASHEINNPLTAIQGESCVNCCSILMPITAGLTNPECSRRVFRPSFCLNVRTAWKPLCFRISR